MEVFQNIYIHMLTNYIQTRTNLTFRWFLFVCFVVWGFFYWFCVVVVF